jgi:hypothetical protein
MMRNLASSLTGLLLLALIITPVTAQNDTCPDIVQDAIATVDTLCDGTGRNQACYGHLTVVAEPQPGITDLLFETPGSIDDVAKIRSLSLSSMDPEVPEWGVSLMRLQAGLPDTLPGQNVTFLLFGDVAIRNAVDYEPPLVQLAATATNAINVRGGPSTTHAVIGSLSNGQTMTADGRNEAGDWLRIQLEGEETGWVYAPLMTVNGEISTLPVVAIAETEAVDTTPSYAPMQAFYFRSGTGAAPCAEAPENGILIQTPGGAGKIDLLVNEVSIQLGSTVFMQADPGQEMVVNVIDGHAQIEAYEVSVFAPAGTRVRVPLDEGGAASGLPEGPEPYDTARLAALPTSSLDQPVPIADALSETEIEEILLSGVPRAGDWFFTFVTQEERLGCSAQARIVPRDTEVGLHFLEDGGFEIPYHWPGIPFYGPGPTFTGHKEYGAPNSDMTMSYYWIEDVTLTVISPEYIEGEWWIETQDGYDRSRTCNYHYTFQMSWLRSEDE